MGDLQRQQYIRAWPSDQLIQITCKPVVTVIVTIKRFHVTLPSILQRKTENSHHVGIQEDRSSYCHLHKISDILMMLLICVESDKIPLLHKLKQLYKRLPVGFFLIDIAYLLITHCTSLFLVYGIVIT